MSILTLAGLCGSLFHVYRRLCGRPKRNAVGHVCARYETPRVPSTWPYAEASRQFLASPDSPQGVLYQRACQDSGKSALLLQSQMKSYSNAALRERSDRSRSKILGSSFLRENAVSLNLLYVLLKPF